MHRYSKQLKIDIVSFGGKKISWTMWGVSTKRYSGWYWASFHKYIAQSVKFIYTYTDRPAMNITALVTVLRALALITRPCVWVLLCTLIPTSLALYALKYLFNGPQVGDTISRITLRTDTCSRCCLPTELMTIVTVARFQKVTFFS